MATERPAEPRRDPLAVIEGAASDNLLLACKDGQVLTNGDFLAMLSPDVLAGAVDAARNDNAGAWPRLGSPSHQKRHCPSKSSCLDGPFCALPVVPMPDDSAEDWLLLLRLVHPGLTPTERPSLQWVSAGNAFGGRLFHRCKGADFKKCPFAVCTA